MIDFRYHLVSLVSVFLALAVGIVLGAGPLKEPFGNTLNQQVKGLAQDKADLRTQLGTANTSVSHRDDFVTDVEPALIGQQLAGRTVVVVALAGVDKKTIDPLTNALATAGATVTGRVTIQDAWSDPGKAAARQSVADQLRGDLPSGSQGDGVGLDIQLAALLARAVVTNGTAVRSDQTAKDVLSKLKGAGLIGISGDLSSRAGAALVLAPGIPTDSNGVQPTTPVAQLDTYVDLAATLDASDSGTVVSGPASAATKNGLVAAVRGDDATDKAVSTVDTGDTPMGVITAILALREQLAGGAGRYGFGAGAQTFLPALAGGSG